MITFASSPLITFSSSPLIKRGPPCVACEAASPPEPQNDGCRLLQLQQQAQLQATGAARSTPEGPLPPPPIGPTHRTPSITRIPLAGMRYALNASHPICSFSSGLKRPHTGVEKRPSFQLRHTQHALFPVARRECVARYFKSTLPLPQQQLDSLVVQRRCTTTALQGPLAASCSCFWPISTKGSLEQVLSLVVPGAWSCPPHFAARPWEE